MSRYPGVYAKLEEARAENAQLLAENARISAVIAAIEDTLDGLGAPECLDELGDGHIIARLFALVDGDPVPAEPEDISEPPFPLMEV